MSWSHSRGGFGCPSRRFAMVNVQTVSAINLYFVYGRRASDWICY